MTSKMKLTQTLKTTKIGTSLKNISPSPSLKKLPDIFFDDSHTTTDVKLEMIPGV